MTMTKTHLTRLMAISEAKPTTYAKDVAGAFRDAFNDDGAVEKMAKLTRRLARLTPAAQDQVLSFLEETATAGSVKVTTEPINLADEVAKARAEHAAGVD